MRWVCLAVSFLAAIQNSGFPADWPHWMGPNRNNVWETDNVIDEFPDGGPKVIWRAPVHGGYSGASVADGKVVVTDYVTQDNVKVGNFERNEFTGVERIVCLDEATGKEIWVHQYPVKYTISYPAGPRCSPIIADGRVYALGAEGHLFCMNLGSGDVIWSHDLKEEYKTKSALWGYSSHPLIDGDRLICLVGGEGSHCVAFHRLTGKELWRTGTATEQGYSPPVIIEAAGVRQLVLTSANSVYAVNPEDGKQYWKVPYEATNGSIIMTPIVHNDLLYIGGYSNKNLLLRLSQSEPAVEEVYRDLRKQAISPVNVQPFAEGPTMFGCDQGGSMMAVDIESGERLWNTAWPLAEDRPVQTGTSFIVKQADRFWLFTETGELVICEMDRSGYKELDRTSVIKPTNVAFGRDVVWAAPAFVGTRVILRNDEECICIELGK